MKFRRSNAQEQQIDISPLIDMVFILLIFFMVSTTFVKDMKLELERPGAASASRAPAPLAPLRRPAPSLTSRRGGPARADRKVERPGPPTWGLNAGRAGRRST